MIQITGSEDTIGLYRLQSLTSVPNTESFTSYPSDTFWLASPPPASGYAYLIVNLDTNGSLYRSHDSAKGFRPMIVTKTGVKVNIIDTNSNGIPEIVIVND